MYKTGKREVLQEVRGEGTMISNRRDAKGGAKEGLQELIYRFMELQVISYSISVESEARSLSIERGGKSSVSRFGHWGERKQKLSRAWGRPAG